MPNPSADSLNTKIRNLTAEVARKNAAIDETQRMAKRAIDDAKAEASEAVQRADRLEDDNSNLRAQLRERDIEIARLGGYLDRVHEEDDVGAERVSTSAAPATEVVRKRRPTRDTGFIRRFDTDGAVRLGV